MTLAAKRSRLNLYEILLTFLALLVIASMPAGCRRAQPPTLVVTELRIPTNDSDYRGLEAVMVRPNDNAPHPLALMTHGTWGGAVERAQSTPLRFIPQAREFARRGWTVVIVMRRGFGDSGGIYMEDAEECSKSPNPGWATQEAAKDLREAATYLATRPEVDGSRMIGVGLSTGGLAMMGLSADAPSGLKAAINFAGGRGADGKDHVCNPDALIRTFGDLGKRSKVPTLWVMRRMIIFSARNWRNSFTRRLWTMGELLDSSPQAHLALTAMSCSLSKERPFGLHSWMTSC